jgi:hypothetical protein
VVAMVVSHQDAADRPRIEAVHLNFISKRIDFISEVQHSSRHDFELIRRASW